MAAATAPRHIPTIVIPQGTDIVIRTDDSVRSGQGSSGQLYPATIEQDVYGSAGSVAIPAGTTAKLVVSNVRSGGAVHSPELVLDLYSIDVHGEQYRVDTSSVTENNKSGLGANRRTAWFAWGGAGIGALRGAVFGGGKGAGIRRPSGSRRRRAYPAIYQGQRDQRTGGDRHDLPIGTNFGDAPLG